MTRKIKSENYVSIQGFMCIDKEQGGLGLKGNDLLIYAIIYGFAQTEGTCYCGSLEYLQEWTRSTRAGVIKNINNLIEMGLIVKVESNPTNKYYLADTVNLVNEDVNLVNNTAVNTVNNGSKQSKQNNIINNNSNNIYKEDVKNNEIIEEVISYLNNKCNTNFRSNTNATKKLIKSRLKEGFTLEDFKKIIDYKYKTWGVKPIKFATGSWSDDYLRPATLFSSEHFESYLHEAIINSEGVRQIDDSVSNKIISQELSDLEF